MDIIFSPRGTIVGPLAAQGMLHLVLAETRDTILSVAPLQAIQGYAHDDVRSIRTLNNLNWVVLQSVPTAQALAPLDQQRTLLAAGTVATGLLLMLITGIAVQLFIIRPVRRLETVMAAVEPGTRAFLLEGEGRAADRTQELIDLIRPWARSVTKQIFG